MWMHTALNELEPLFEAQHQRDERRFNERRQWLRTALAVAGIRGALPLTEELSQREFGEPEQETIDLRYSAREEILKAIDREGDRAYAAELVADLSARAPTR